MGKDLLKFLFEDSFKPDSDEALARILDELKDVEMIETGKKDLEKELKKLGFDKHPLTPGVGALILTLPDETTYGKVKSAVMCPAVLLDLMKAGWTPVFNDDMDTTMEPGAFRVSFICVDEIEPENADPSKEVSPDNLEKIQKHLQVSGDSRELGKPEPKLKDSLTNFRLSNLPTWVKQSDMTKIMLDHGQSQVNVVRIEDGVFEVNGSNAVSESDLRKSLARYDTTLDKDDIEIEDLGESDFDHDTRDRDGHEPIEAFKVGDKVKVSSLLPDEEGDESFVGKTGTVTNTDAEEGGMVIVKFDDDREDGFWPEELEPV